MTILSYKYTLKAALVAALLSLLFTLSTVASASADSQPDLVVGALGLDEVISDPQQLTITGALDVTVKNVGVQATLGAFTAIAFEDISGNGKYDIGLDNLLGTVEVLQNIAAAGNLVVQVPLDGTVKFKGNLIFVQLDSSDVIDEVSEDNNFYNTGLLSKYIPPPVPFTPVVEWNKKDFVVRPDSNQVMMAPAVADLDLDGIPEVIFSTFTGSSYSGGGVLRAIRGDDGSEVWSLDLSGPKVLPSAGLAVGNIDDDPYPEIVVRRNDFKLMAVNHDGTVKWIGPAIPGYLQSYGSASIADIDHDGVPEIVIGAIVINADGSVRWVGQYGQGQNVGGPLSVVADLDLDGSPEVVAGRTAYRADGTIYWNGLPQYGDGSVAIGNFDSDSFPEIVVVNAGTLRLLEHDGTYKWGLIAIPGGGHGGAPTVADVDGDGIPEIGIAGATRYVVFRADGSVLWQSVIQDQSSSETGSSVFDFDGDGSAEVVYGDELYLRIYRGYDGAILYELPKGSGTTMELPVVADVDGDGQAEIVAAANNYVFGAQNGILVIGGGAQSWVNTRKIWNQHQYHVTNVNEDGSIPQYEQNNWLLPELNNFRQNLFLPGEGAEFAAPDLIPSYLRTSDQSCDSTANITVRVGNGGSSSVPTGAVARFVHIRPDGTENILGTTTTDGVILPGHYQDITLPWDAPEIGYQLIRVDLDATDNPPGDVAEGFEQNNSTVAVLGICVGPVVNDLIVKSSFLDINLTWSEPSGGALGEEFSYYIYRAVEDLPFQKIGETQLTSFTDVTAQAGINYYYMIRVLRADGRIGLEGNIGSGTITIPQCTSDSAPCIISAPNTGAVVGQLYNYSVDAVDPDVGDTLTFTLITGPPGMMINSASGLVTWTPTTYGASQVKLKVSDAIGHETFQFYNINSALVPFNSPPSFVSTPITTASGGQLYSYLAKASDPNPIDTLTYALLSAPEGMTINSSTGKIKWTPANEFGTASVTVSVTDSGGLVAEQSFAINVAVNSPPTITSEPTLVAARLVTYTYQVVANDPDNNPLLFSLIEKPIGMTISSTTGIIAWAPALNQIGPHNVTVRATDPGGLFATQSFTLTVLPNEAPHFISATVNNAAAEAPYSYDADAVDGDSFNLLYILVTAPAGMSINSQSGLISWLPGTGDIGSHSVSISVSDAEGLTAIQNYTVSVGPVGSNGGGNQPLGDITVTMNSPAYGSTISVKSELFATITSTTGPPDSWSAKLIRAGTDFSVPLGSAPGGLTNQSIGFIDPTFLPNDPYIVEIAVTKGSATGYYTFPYDISSYLKLGEFAFKVSDLTIPLTGLPITIRRAYSTLDREQYEFGAGWRLDIPGRVVDSADELLGETFISNTRVFVTRPDGKRVGFSFTPYKLHPFFPFWIPAFTPDPGVTDVLEVDETVLFNSEGTFWELFGEYNPSKFYLTTRERVRYTIDEAQGLLEARDANFNTLTFTDGAITHSSGAAISLERDSEGRVTKITDLNGGQILYSYSASGDLLSVTNQSGEVTSYTYDVGPISHLLKTITLNDGTKILENIYSPDGRLIKQIDGEGHETLIGINVDAQSEVVTDRRGNITTYKYDTAGNLIQRVQPGGITWNYTYDANYNQTSETDPLGNTTSRVFDAKSRMLSETDALGATTTRTYNDLGQELTLTNALGATSSKSYNDYGNLTSETDFLGHTKTYQYDSVGNLISTTDATGSTWISSYDGTGRLIQSVDPTGAAINISYDANGNLTQQSRSRIDSSGVTHNVTTAVEYDAQNRAIKLIDGEGGVSLATYNVYGDPAQVTDKNGNIKIFEYDSAGRRTRTLYADGTDEKQEYDAEGNLIKTTDRVGRVTQYQYDELGRQILIIYPDLSQSSTTYDSVGRMLSETNTRGAITTYQYDATGRKIAEIDALGATTKYSYDNIGNQISITDALGRITSYQYDANSQQTLAINPDGSTTSSVFDAEGREIEERDELNSKTSYQYDVLGRLSAVIDNLNQTTSYIYDAIGNKVKQIDAKGHVTIFDYDNSGKVIKKTLPLGQFETTTYDPNGNVISKKDYNGAVTNFAYDSNNRLITKTYPDNTSVTYSYFADGQRYQVTDSSGVSTSQYNARGWLTSSVTPEGTITYQYDSEGNRTQLATPGGAVNYTFDVLDRLVQVDDLSGGVTQYAYDPVGNQLAVLYPNGTRTETIYNSRNQVVRVETRDGTQNVVQRFEYGLDSVGNRLSITELGGRVSSYQYDSIYRLLEEKITEPSLASSITQYSYDSVGNRLVQTRDGVVTNYGYDANDRLLSAGGETFSYDNNGNTLSGASGAETYTWDFEDRLVGFSKPGFTAQFGYDSDGIKVSDTINGVLSRSLIDQNQDYAQVIEERDGGGDLQTRYTYGSDLLSQNGVGGKSFYHYDALGSTRALSGNSGQITDSYGYRAFGEISQQVGSTSNKYLFTGEQYSAQMGGYYLRSRWMKPGVGRFLSSDKFEFEDGYTAELMRYGYAAHNPVNEIDPSGEAVFAEFNIQLKKAMAAAPSMLGLGYTIACRFMTVARVFDELTGSRYDDYTYMADYLPACKIKFPFSWVTGWYKRHVGYSNGRRQVYYYFKTKKQAWDAVRRSAAGPWKKNGKIQRPDPPHGPKELPHYHDNHHGNKKKSNKHYMFSE